MTKANDKTWELYNKLGTQEKRAVNRLMRGLSEGGIGKPDLGRICRGISRACQGKDEGHKKINGYILYYKERYPIVKAKMPAAGLGEIARSVGAEWKNLSKDEKAKFNKRAREAS
jgi:hypothetical protein